MSGHTPGRWIEQQESGVMWVEAEGTGRVICDMMVEEFGEVAGDEETANARLIAAAPDLLKELQNIADANPSTWDVDMRDQFREWAQSRARAAIRKATGGTQ